MRISISVATTISSMPQIMFSGQLDQHCALLGSMGYDGIDLFFPDPLHTDVREVKNSLEKNALRVTMLAAQGDLMADGLYLNTPDKTRLNELLERSRRHLDMCAQLEAMPNIGFLRGRHAATEPRDESLKRMANGLCAYCELAQSMGVDVLLEPICRYEINTINTTRQALDLHKGAGSPFNLGLLLDLFHMNIEESSVCGAIVEAGTHIRHVHFVDNTRAIPGAGCLPLRDITTSLAAVGYTGFLGVEAIPGLEPEKEARCALTFTQMLLTQRNERNL